MVVQEPELPAVLYVDLHLVHEVTSPQAFDGLRRRGLRVRRPDLTRATTDHSIPTLDREPDPIAATQLDRLRDNCAEFGIRLHQRGDPDQGIVHVIGPELGLTRPGMTIVCGDSHTATHGAFGALAFGIGTSEVEHVLATQCTLQHKPNCFAVDLDGRLPPGVTAKDIILSLIARIGIGGATGCAFEYRGSTVRELSMDARMTVCNMSIEAGARAGMMAPDDTCFSYLAGRPGVATGAAWDAAVARWRSLRADPDAVYDRQVAIDVAALAPMITYGTNPSMAIAIDGAVPEPADTDQPEAVAKALSYMKVAAGRPLLGHPVDVVFVGSCTNGRLEDLRAAARLLGGRRVAPGVRMLVVPGSQHVAAAARAEGLDRLVLHAGAEWRQPGCSMCIAMNGDMLAPGQYAVSTSNRNFEGRQGPGGRTFLASPLTAAAAAVTGAIADPRPLVGK